GGKEGERGRPVFEIVQMPADLHESAYLGFVFKVLNDGSRHGGEGGGPCRVLRAEHSRQQGVEIRQPLVYFIECRKFLGGLPCGSPRSAAGQQIGGGRSQIGHEPADSCSNWRSIVSSNPMMKSAASAG